MLAAWFTVFRMEWILMGREPRWSAWRITMESSSIGMVLILIGVARAWDDFDTPAVAWGFVTVIALALASVGAIYAYAESRRRNVRLPGRSRSSVAGEAAPSH